MDYICGINYKPFPVRGSLEPEEVRAQLGLIKATHANTVILTPAGMQETAQSEEIDYRSEATCGDDELKSCVEAAKELGLKVFLKPTVNCKNGTWRAHINFFDEDVVCEPKWSNWFESYRDFQVHFAEIAREEGCEMFLPGCEMVMSERREAEWRALIGELRSYYKGPISYNTDKYQEHNVKWWDAVDVISSSGYYPIGDFDRQLDRIEKAVMQYDKPFFFAELGCMSVHGSSHVPNDWQVRGEKDLKEQDDWYEEMFSACGKRDWVRGMALWSWSEPKADAYDIYGKPAEKTVGRYFSEFGKR